MPVDNYNMKAVLENFPKQCREALNLPKGQSVPSKIRNIAICGMGGSAIGGSLLKAYMEHQDSDIPVYVIRDYKLPEFIGKDSLVFAVSYSGNTEETLDLAKEARDRGAYVFAITSGGKLAMEFEKQILIPSELQPRQAVGYLFFPMLGLLFNSGLVEVKNDDLNEMLEIIKDVKHFEEQGDALAKKIGKKTPIFYAASHLDAVAYRLKTQFNENSKVAAFNHVMPEFNHNELVGYKGMERSKFLAIFIKDKDDHPQIVKRWQICKEIMEENVDVEAIVTEGNSFLARMFSTIYLGDWASYYLAIRDRVDPTPVDVIKTLKQKIGE